MLYHVFSRLAVLLAISSLAAAQDLSAYPPCSQGCLAEQIVKSPCYSGGTQLSSQISCLCKDQSYLAGTTKCIQAACSPADGQKAYQVGLGICEQAGVPAAQYSSLAIGAGATAASGAAPTGASNGTSGTTTADAGSMTGSMATSTSSTGGGNGATATSANQANASSTGAAEGRKEVAAALAAAGWAGMLGMILGGL